MDNTTIKPGSRVTGENRTNLAKELRARYDAGESLRQLADATGRSYGFINRILTENGGKLRTRGATRGKKTT